jgi:hypothetical protein
MSFYNHQKEVTHTQATKCNTITAKSNSTQNLSNGFQPDRAHNPKKTISVQCSSLHHAIFSAGPEPALIDSAARFKACQPSNLTNP